jgi:uncharacterized metal-binding protein
MPDGKTHFKWWMRGLPVVGGFSVAMAYPNPVFAAGNSLGYLMGAVMDPDLDQIGLSSTEGRAMRSAGLLGVFWVMYWMPYAYILPHRSFWSHFPYISTAIRLAYLFAPFIGIAYYFDVLGYIEHPVVIMLLAGLWNGLSLADTIHYTLDILHTPRRRR